MIRLGKRNIQAFEGDAPAAAGLKKAKSNDFASFDAIKCGLCLKLFDAMNDFDKVMYFSSCAHVFCQNCIRKEAENLVPRDGCLSCHECKQTVIPEDIKVPTFPPIAV